MKLAFPYLKTVLTFEENTTTALIVEHQGLFRKIVADISTQVGGEDGEAVFSIDNTPKAFKTNVEFLQQWAPFDLNTKTLQTALLKSPARPQNSAIVWCTKSTGAHGSRRRSRQQRARQR